jgi:hypothetical protein
MPPQTPQAPARGPSQAEQDAKVREMAILSQAIRKAGKGTAAAGHPAGRPEAKPPGGIAGSVQFPPNLHPADPSGGVASEDYPDSVAAHLGSLVAGGYAGTYDSGPYESAEDEFASARVAPPRKVPDLLPYLSAAPLTRPRLSGGVLYEAGGWLVVGPGGEVFCVTADEFAARYDRAASGEARASARRRLAGKAPAAPPPAPEGGLDEGAGI